MGTIRSKIHSLVTVLRDDRPPVLSAPTTVIIGVDPRIPLPELSRSRPLHLHIVRERSDPVFQGAVPAARQRFAARMMAKYGDVGLLARTDDGEVVGWTWICPTSFRDPTSGLRSRLAPDEVWIYDTAALRTPYRGLRAADFLIREMHRFIREEFGANYYYSAIDTGNHRSLLLAERIGAVEVQRTRSLLLLQQRGIQVPLSSRPAYGPCSRDGRHRTRGLAPSFN